MQQEYVKLTVLITSQQLAYLQLRERERGAKLADTVGRSLNLAALVDEYRAAGGVPQIAYGDVAYTLNIPE